MTLNILANVFRLRGKTTSDKGGFETNFVKIVNPSDRARIDNAMTVLMRFGSGTSPDAVVIIALSGQCYTQMQ